MGPRNAAESLPNGLPCPVSSLGTRNKSAPWPSSRKRDRSQVMSFHLMHFDHPGREIPLFLMPGQPLLMPEPAQPGALGGNCVLCGTPARCSGSWRGCGAPASSVWVNAWLRTLPSQVIWGNTVAFNGVSANTDRGLSCEMGLYSASPSSSVSSPTAIRQENLKTCKLQLDSLPALPGQQDTHHFPQAFSLLSRGELLGQAQARSCTRVSQGMQVQHQDHSWARGVVFPSQIPHQVLGVFPVQLSGADYHQLSRFPAF